MAVDNACLNATVRLVLFGITHAELIVMGAVVLNLIGQSVAVLELIVPHVVDVGEIPTSELAPPSAAET